MEHAREEREKSVRREKREKKAWREIRNIMLQ